MEKEAPLRKLHFAGGAAHAQATDEDRNASERYLLCARVVHRGGRQAVFARAGQAHQERRHVRARKCAQPAARARPAGVYGLGHQGLQPPLLRRAAQESGGLVLVRHDRHGQLQAHQRPLRPSGGRRGALSRGAGHQIADPQRRRARALRGDEFFLLFRDLPQQILEKKLQSIRAALDEIVIEEYPEPYISASIGGAFAAGRILRTIRRADLAMYQAKLKKDCVAIYREAKERET